MFRKWWFGVVVIGFAAAAAVAKLGTVTTNDDRLLTGDVQEAPDGKSVTVTIRGSTITVPRSNVIAIHYPADADSDFRQRLSILDPNDVKGRLDLSHMELNAKQYDLAAEAARDAEALDPHNPDAAVLLDTIQSQRALEAKMALPSTEPSAESTTTPTPAGYLTNNDIYAIRRAELRPDDNVRVEFYNNVRQRYLGLHGNMAAFFDESQTQQALDILQSGDPHLADDVRIVTDPRVLLEFRAQVQPRILAGCAATGCHASGAGGFFLYTEARQPMAAYTNFYILQKSGSKIAGADTFGKGPAYRPMVDRLRPESSLILQFGLPRLAATTPHPDVKDYTPMYRDTNDPAYRQVLNWIGDLSPMAPDYGIKFHIPHKAPTTRGS
jgi:hypothetical protein